MRCMDVSFEWDFDKEMPVGDMNKAGNIDANIGESLVNGR